MVDAPVPILDRGVVRPRSPHRSPTCSIVLYPPGATLGPRIQMDYQPVLLHTGSVHVTVDGIPRDMPAGHVGLMLPGALGFFAFARDRATRHRRMALGLQFLDQRTRRALDGAVNCLSLSAAMQTCAELARDAVAVDEPAEQPVLSAMVQAALTLYLAEATHVATARAAEHPAIARAIGSFPTRPARRVSSIAMFQNSHNGPGVSGRGLNPPPRQHEA